MEPIEAHHFNMRVYIEDTDRMGIVYHANYLCFFERARTEIIRKAGLSLTTLAMDNCHFVINDVQLRYLHPAYLDDLLTITTRVHEKKSCSLLFEQVMHNQYNRLLSEAVIKIVCVNEHLRPQRLPKNVF